MNILYFIAAFGLALGILIVVHEYGHYWVARRCGVKVLRFSIGFGKPLWAWKSPRSGTEWALGAFPLGGYVKMLDESEGEVAAADLPHAFNRQGVWRRFLIVLAGPVSNLILAVAVYWVLFIHGMPGVRPVLGEVPAGSAAAAAGFKARDVIASVDDVAVQTWQDARWLLMKQVVDKREVRVETRGESGEVAFHLLETASLGPDDLEGDFLAKLGLTHFRPVLKPVVGRVMPGGAAEGAGLREGDEILMADGKAIATWDDLVATVGKSAGHAVTFTIRRDGAERRIVVTPATADEKGKRVGRIGVEPKVDTAALEKLLLTEVRYPPARAFVESLRKTGDTAWFSLEMLGKMLTGQVSVKNISGPITIAYYAGQSAHMGWQPYLIFLALISISLGVLNLLPVPLLDGGHLMYYMAEIVKGRPVSERTQEIGQKVGMAILLTLMAFAFYNDINRLF